VPSRQSSLRLRRVYGLGTVTSPLWDSLQEAAGAFAPRFEVASSDPTKLSLVLRDPSGSRELELRYRSERGLFLRTYFLVLEAEVAGVGPATAGALALRRRRLVWRRPKPPHGKLWSERLSPPALKATLKRLPVERLRLNWNPLAQRWRLVVETVVGGVTATFFPPLLTPNPLRREEADALIALVEALARAAAGD
jgi:hypothetical protein